MKEEEGEYEWASYHHGVKPEGESQEVHVEPAVLYQSLGEVSSTYGLSEEWRHIFIEYGSRCEQYGGRWKRHRCVGTRKSGGPSRKSCAIQAGVEAFGGVIGILVPPVGAVSAAGAVVTAANCA
jgi:hypothetical protein